MYQTTWSTTAKQPEQHYHNKNKNNNNETPKQCHKQSQQCTTPTNTPSWPNNSKSNNKNATIIITQNT